MTSGNFSLVPVDSIIVDEKRQRKEFNNNDQLVESIRDRGLMNPIVITRDNQLVAGERRLRAHRTLGFDTIAVHYTDEVDPTELHLLELEENVRRSDLTWQEKNDAIADYHRLLSEQSSEWSQEASAKALNISASELGKQLLVKRTRDEGVTEVEESPKFSSAYNFSARKAERKKADAARATDKALDDMFSPKTEEPEESSEPASSITPASRFSEIQNQDCVEFFREPQSTFYNFIHCDFPYGVDATKVGQSAAKSHGGYSDRPEDYFKLLGTFLMYQDNFIAPSAHMMFWFSQKFFTTTKDSLIAHGWNVNDFLLIWHRSDSKGIIPDTNRGGRRTYETAFLCSRGDRKVVRPVDMSYAGKTTKEYHMSEKPHAMLTHFFRMFVDESTLMLDPTAGSGMAVKVAEELGAKYSLGLERDPEYHARALENLGY